MRNIFYVLAFFFFSACQHPHIKGKIPSTSSYSCRVQIATGHSTKKRMDFYHRLKMSLKKRMLQEGWRYSILGRYGLEASLRKEDSLVSSFLFVDGEDVSLGFLLLSKNEREVHQLFLYLRNIIRSLHPSFKVSFEKV